MYKELTPKQRVRKIDGIIKRIEQERQDHLSGKNIVEVCIYDHIGLGRKAIKHCSDCGDPLCQYCGFGLDGKYYCNKCYGIER